MRLRQVVQELQIGGNSFPAGRRAACHMDHDLQAVD
jgi:hypothetical protein